jgi:hypothetical protein
LEGARVRGNQSPICSLKELDLILTATEYTEVIKLGGVGGGGERQRGASQDALTITQEIAGILNTACEIGQRG